MITFNGSSVLQNDTADFHVKSQKAASSQQEDTNIRLVNGKSFAPKTIVSCDDKVYSTRGVPYEKFLLDLTQPEDVCKTIVAAYRLIDNLHHCGFYHLDAKFNNIVVFEGLRKDGVNFNGSFGVKHLAFIDFETLWAPDTMLTTDEVQIFNESSDSLVEYGWKHHAYYKNNKNAYRYDVHTFTSSLKFLYVNGNDVLKPLHSACATILGHIPDSVWGLDVNGTRREFSEYLLSAAHPVMPASRAVTVVQACFFPLKMRQVVWRTEACNCTAVDFCQECVDYANKELNNNCHISSPDIIGDSDEDIRELKRECRNYLDEDGQFENVLIFLGARKGDVLRLAGI